MKNEHKPSPLPENLRSALCTIMERLWEERYSDLLIKLRDELLMDALEVFRGSKAGRRLRTIHVQGESTCSEVMNSDKEAVNHER